MQLLIHEKNHVEIGDVLEYTRVIWKVLKYSST